MSSLFYTTRPLLQAIPNVNAIVRYDVSFAVDHLGGRSIHDPARWTNVAAFHVS